GAPGAAQGGRPIAGPVETEFLTDGGQTAESVAATVAGFLDGALQSLEIALYDLRLEGAAATAILEATRRARARGVPVRILFNQDHARPAPDPPPPAVDWDFVKQHGEWRPVPGIPDLMHHKYVIRDTGTPAAAVLSGPPTWTTHSCTRD